MKNEKFLVIEVGTFGEDIEQKCLSTLLSGFLLELDESDLNILSPELKEIGFISSGIVFVEIDPIISIEMNKHKFHLITLMLGLSDS